MGQYLGRALARAGADLVITSRDAATLAPFQREIESLGRRVLSLALDVRDHGSIQRAVAAAVAHYGKIDILVNNAGCNVRKPALDVTWDDWNLVLDTNLRGTFFVAQAVARHMIERKYGRIINIGSVNGQAGQMGQVNYCAAKAGIKGFTKALALEGARYGITVNEVAPGYTDTDMVAAVPANVLEGIIAKIPIGRLGRADEIGRAVAFLADEKAGFITGSVVSVNGGQNMY